MHAHTHPQLFLSSFLGGLHGCVRTRPDGQTCKCDYHRVDHAHAACTQGLSAVAGGHAKDRCDTLQKAHARLCTHTSSTRAACSMLDMRCQTRPGWAGKRGMACRRGDVMHATIHPRSTPQADNAPSPDQSKRM